MNSRPTGFTLLEVMVALAVFAVVSLALVKNTGMALRQADQVAQRSVAFWLAEDQMTRLRLMPRANGSFPTLGVNRTSRRAGNADWEIQSHIETTDNNDIRRVTVQVHPRGDQDYIAAELVGFIGRH